MKTISFSAIKGGVGKSSLAIVTANLLAKAGNRVLVIDMDIQNSMSFYFLDDPDIIEKHNIALALHEKNLEDHILPTHKENVHIIPSSFFLVDLRALSEYRLKQLIPSIAKRYNFCVIDTAPTYDNLVLNAIHASDLIISPVELSQFNFKGAAFYRDKLTTETDKLENWYIIINSFSAARQGSNNSLINQYLELFESQFENILPVRIPRSSSLQKYIDTGETLSLASRKRSLFEAMKNFVEMISDINMNEIKRI